MRTRIANKGLLSFLLITILSQGSLSQENKFVFGSVPESDLKMKVFAGDKEAEALVLYEKGEISFVKDYVENQLNLAFKRTIRIKILKKSALNLANVSIGYYLGGYNRDQKVVNIKAMSYGFSDSGYQQRNLDESKIISEKIDSEYALKKFSIPNVKVGSVIEYQYTIETPNSSGVPDWEFQNTLPTRVSEFQISLTPFYAYTYLLQGTDKFSKTTSQESSGKRTYAGIEFTDMTYNFWMNDLPAFRDETFITSKRDYIVKMDWQLTEINYPDGRSDQFMSTWPEISNELLKSQNYGKFIQSSQRSNKKLSTQLSLDGLSQLEKAKKITKHVQESYNWDGYYQKYTNVSSKEFQKQKTGSSSEINLHLTGLLKAAGIDAKPVLISTRSHGKVKEEHPLIGFFNSSIVIASIDNSYYLMDGTESMLPFGWLPPECINEKGLIVEKNGESWIDLSAEPISTIRESMSLEIDVEMGTVKGDFKKLLTGYDAIRHKKDTELVENELEAYEVEGELERSGLDQSEGNLIITYSAEIEAIDVLNNIINIRPFLNKPWGSNPLKAKTRTYPVDLIYKRNREYISNIDIPEGYTIDILPEGISTENNLVKIEYTAVKSENEVIVQASYLFKKSVYQPKEYLQIRRHIDMFIDKFNERIVFKRM